MNIYIYNGVEETFPQLPWFQVRCLKKTTALLHLANVFILIPCVCVCWGALLWVWSLHPSCAGWAWLPPGSCPDCSHPSGTQTHRGPASPHTVTHTNMFEHTMMHKNKQTNKQNSWLCLKENSLKKKDYFFNTTGKLVHHSAYIRFYENTALIILRCISKVIMDKSLSISNVGGEYSINAYV